MLLKLVIIIYYMYASAFRDLVTSISLRGGAKMVWKCLFLMAKNLVGGVIGVVTYPDQ